VRVKCIANARASLTTPAALAAYDEDASDDEVWLVVGKTYVVFGIAINHGEPWYLVCEEEDDTYPKPHLGAFFAIIDPAIPPGWAVALDGNAGPFAILPRMWAEDASFLERLVDEDPEALARFAELRKQHELGS
jgi:hypothetical protein